MIHPGRHRRSVFAAYLVVVVVLLLAPITIELPSPELTWTDKVIHLFLFAGVGFLGFWNRPSALAIAFFTAVLAGTLELIQGPLPYRSAELLDFVAGAVGGVGGVGLAVRFGDVGRADGRTGRRADGQAGGTPRPPGEWKGGGGPPG